MGQCKAHSKRTGKPCGKDAIKGGSVCRMHGGSAPQVRASAEARLRALVDPAIGVLEYAMKQKTKQLKVASSVAMDVLDRNGHKQAQKIELDAMIDTKQFDFSGLSSEELVTLRTMLEKSLQTDEGFSLAREEEK